jgi:hypothetical protein
MLARDLSRLSTVLFERLENFEKICIDNWFGAFTLHGRFDSTATVAGTS